MKWTLTTLAILCALATPAWAANIEAHSICSYLDTSKSYLCPTKNDILIEGEIVPGDARKFERVVRGIGRRVGGVVLRSPGGSVSDAMAIGRLVRKLMIRTEGPGFDDKGNGPSCERDYDHQNASCVCASACFLIYAGGFPRNESYVLLHRPFIDPSANARMTYDESMRAAEDARREVAEYLREMGIHDRFASIMFSTPSSAAAPVSFSDARHVLAGYPPDVEEWIMSKCGAITTGQVEDQLDVIGRYDVTERSYPYWVRYLCSNREIMPKRDAARLDWFGPVTAAEIAKDEEMSRKFDAIFERSPKQ